MPPKRAKTSKATGNSDYVEKTPPAKKRRTGKTTVTMANKSDKKPRGGLKGMLGMLPEMPLDILYDVRPSQVLQLTRLISPTLLDIWSSKTTRRFKSCTHDTRFTWRCNETFCVFNLEAHFPERS